MPASSPGVTPIEPAFRKRKPLLRCVQARTQEALATAIAAAFASCITADARTGCYLAGYTLDADPAGQPG